MIDVKCPNTACPAHYQVPDEFSGKGVVCKKCNTRFKVQGANGVIRTHQPPVASVVSKPTVPQKPGKSRLLLVFAGLAVFSFGSCLALSCLGGAGYYFFIRTKVRGPETYAGIEISSTEVRPFACEFFPDPEGGFDYKFLSDRQWKDKASLKKLNDAGDFDPKALQETVATIARIYKELQAKYKVKADKTVIVCGSGVFKEIESKASEQQLSEEEKKMRVERNKAQLKTLVHEKIGQDVEFVSAKLELDLQIKVLIPEKFVDKTVLIDMGNSGCRGGCLTKTGKSVYLDVIGVKAFTKKVEKAAAALGWIKSKNNKQRDIFIEAAAAVADEEFRKPFVKALQENEELTGRKRFHMVGGIPWVIATYKNPAGRGETHTRLTAQNIEDFYKEVRTARDFPALAIPQGLNPDLTKKLNEDNEEMPKNIAPENLIAGTEMLKVIAEELRFADPGREVYFNNYGQQAMMLGFMQKMWEKFGKN